MKRIAVSLLLLLTACGPRQVTPPAKTVQDGLRQEAQAACLCERTGKGRPACWRAFDRDTARFGKPQRDATACAPISTQGLCFGDRAKEGGHFCVTTGYRLVTRLGVTLCTPAEARAVESLWMRIEDPASRATGPTPTTPADIEAERLALSFVRGADPGNPPPSNGCAG